MVAGGGGMAAVSMGVCILRCLVAGASFMELKAVQEETNRVLQKERGQSLWKLRLCEEIRESRSWREFLAWG